VRQEETILFVSKMEIVEFNYETERIDIVKRFDNYLNS